MLLILIVALPALAFLGLIIYLIFAKMRKRPNGITTTGVIMLVYSLLFLVFSLFNFHLIFTYYLSDKLRFYLPLPVGLIYFISSFNILRLKNWARILAVYFSGLMVIWYVFIFSWAFIEGYKEGALFYSGETNFTWNLIGLISVTPIFIPNLLFLIFLTRPTIKEQFR